MPTTLTRLLLLAAAVTAAHAAPAADPAGPVAEFPLASDGHRPQAIVAGRTATCGRRK